MKKFICISAAVLALVACENKMSVESPIIKAYIAADVENCEKGTFDPSTLEYSFAIGDSVSLFKEDVVSNNNFKFKSTGNGKSASFTCELPADFAADNNLYVYTPYLKDWSGSSSTSTTQILDQVQSGKIEDFGKYNIAWGKTTGNTIADGVFSCSVTLSNLIPVLKFTGIDAANKITRIRLETTDTGVGLSGQYTYKVKMSGAKKIYSTANAVNYVEVYRGGEIISGDVYIFILTTNYDEDGKYFYNAAKNLKLTVTNSEGAEYTKNAKLNTVARAGRIKNLGSLGTIAFPAPKNPAKPSFCDASRPRVTLTNVPEGSTCYYTIGNSEDIASPTTESDVLDIENGIYFGTNEDNSTYDYDAKFIKILVKNPSYSDTEFKIFTRAWAVRDKSTAQSDYNNTEFDFKEGTCGEFVTNGLTISSTGVYNKFSTTSANGWSINSKITFGFNPAHAGKGTLYLYAKGSGTTVGSKRYIDVKKGEDLVERVTIELTETNNFVLHAPVDCGDITTSKSMTVQPTSTSQHYIAYLAFLEYGW